MPAWTVQREAMSASTPEAALASVAMALFLVGLKGWASWETGSVAMLGSLADTALDFVASLIVLFGVKLAAIPADEDPVTGSAHAAVVPFWAQRHGRERFSALQASKRTGHIECELRDDRVLLGGQAVTVIEGHFQL